MNCDMAYLLGMICGNGTLSRTNRDTTISIRFPHKKLKTESGQDVSIYVAASIMDIRSILDPLVGSAMRTTQDKHVTTLYFNKINEDYLIREIYKYTGSALVASTMRVHNYFFTAPYDERISFLQGFADVTAYIRRTNYCFQKYKHRVYIEIPSNWEMVIDIANLLKSIDIPVQTIDWAHPNMRDPQLKKYNQGNHLFWKKEHQIKVWANEFEKIGFAVKHKQAALTMLSGELTNELMRKGHDSNNKTHKYYWESQTVEKIKDKHPAVNHNSIPLSIRGQNYNSWTDVARVLGYHE